MESNGSSTANLMMVVNREKAQKGYREGGPSQPCKIAIIQGFISCSRPYFR